MQKKMNSVLGAILAATTVMVFTYRVLDLQYSAPAGTFTIKDLNPGSATREAAMLNRATPPEHRQGAH